MCLANFPCSVQGRGRDIGARTAQTEECIQLSATCGSLVERWKRYLEFLSTRSNVPISSKNLLNRQCCLASVWWTEQFYPRQQFLADYSACAINQVQCIELIFSRFIIEETGTAFVLTVRHIRLLTSTDSLDMSTGVMRLSADSRCRRCRACSSTAMRNASWMMLWPMSDTVTIQTTVSMCSSFYKQTCNLWHYIPVKLDHKNRRDGTIIYLI